MLVQIVAAVLAEPVFLVVYGRRVAEKAVDVQKPRLADSGEHDERRGVRWNKSRTGPSKAEGDSNATGRQAPERGREHPLDRRTRWAELPDESRVHGAIMGNQCAF